MSEWSMKRFWKTASVTEYAGGFGVTLDDRPIRTPAKAALTMPTRALAEAVAEEWQAQTDTVRPDTMPVTRSANSAIDKVQPQRDAVIAMLADYGGTDLLSYRAERPDELIARQARDWDPMLDWADTAFGARLNTTSGVMPIAQDPEALRRLATPLHRMGAFELAAVHDMISLTGSLVLGLAAAQGAQPPVRIWELSRLDEEWQIELWGRDDEADAMAARKRDDFLHADRFLRLARAAQGLCN